MRQRARRRRVVIRATVRARSGLLMAVVLFCGCGRAGSGLPAADRQDPIARIGDREVTAEAFHDYLVDIFGSEEEVENSNELLSRLLDQYLEEQILLSRAREMDLEADDEELQQFLENQAPRLEEFEPAERDRFLQNVRDSLLARKLKEMVVAERVKINPGEVERYYNEERERFHRSTRIQLRQILVDDQAQAEAVIGELRKNPSQFQEMAGIHSEAPDRGMTGSYEEAELPEEIRNAVAGLNDGDISGIVQDPQGFHIFQVVSREGDQELPLEEVHRDIETILLREKSEKALAEYVLELRKEIPVTIVKENLGFDYVERN